MCVGDEVHFDQEIENEKCFIKLFQSILQDRVGDSMAVFIPVTFVERGIPKKFLALKNICPFQ